MPRITGASLDDATIQRLGGHGDNWYSTWGADGSLYVAMCDGNGFPGTRMRSYNSALYRVEGTPETGLTFHDVPGYPDLSDPVDGGPERDVPRSRYYAFGTLDVDGTIYQYLDTWNIPTTRINRRTQTLRFVGAKLIYSPDDGGTWHNQDGSTPVVWEDWEDERSRKTLVFYKEPGETFSLHSILQMGKGYELNTDGFVYVYAPNGNEEGNMNQLVMFRVPKGEILDRSAYEYFAGLGADGGATWSSDIGERGIVHTFPSGWVNVNNHPYAWQPSVTYNPALGVYLMANWATPPTEDDFWFGGPSYLGLYQSPTPWGPWEQFYEDTAWAPGGDQNARCYQPQIIPSWISEDGKSFWLVWTDFQHAFDADTRETRFRELKEAGAPDEAFVQLTRDAMPYYAFNLQRVELTTVGD
jgi:hypothetical protein